MHWNHRIVELNRGENAWFEVQEVFYNDDGSIAGHSDVCVGDEYPERIVAVLQRMIDDIKRNPAIISVEQVVGFHANEEAHF